MPRLRSAIPADPAGRSETSGLRCTRPPSTGYPRRSNRVPSNRFRSHSSSDCDDIVLPESVDNVDPIHAVHVDDSAEGLLQTITASIVKLKSKLKDGNANLQRQTARLEHAKKANVAKRKQLETLKLKYDEAVTDSENAKKDVSLKEKTIADGTTREHILLAQLEEAKGKIVDLEEEI